MVTPDHTTSYILTTRHDGGGCVDKDTVVVKASIIDSSLRLAGSPKYCSDSGDSAVLHVQPTAMELTILHTGLPKPDLIMPAW